MEFQKYIQTKSDDTRLKELINDFINNLSEDKNTQKHERVAGIKNALDYVFNAHATGTSSYATQRVGGKKLTVRISDHIGYTPDVYIHNPERASIHPTDYMIDIIIDNKVRGFEGEDDMNDEDFKYARLFVSTPNKIEDAFDVMFIIDELVDRVNSELTENMDFEPTKKLGGIIDVKHSSLGTAKKTGISPIIKEHDMIAECGDCGDKFSYQNSKNHIL